MPSEKNTQQAILEYLTRRSIFHYRNNTGAVKVDKRFFRFGANGSPDIICVDGGRFIGIECKGPKGKLSDDQVLFKINLERAGGLYLMVRSIDEFIQLWNSK